MRLVSFFLFFAASSSCSNFVCHARPAPTKDLRVQPHGVTDESTSTTTATTANASASINTKPIETLQTTTTTIPELKTWSHSNKNGKKFNMVLIRPPGVGPDLDTLAHHLEKQMVPNWLRKQRAKATTSSGAALTKLPLDPLAHQIETQSCGKRFAKMCKRGRAVSTTVCRAATLSYSSNSTTNIGHVNNASNNPTSREASLSSSSFPPSAPTPPSPLPPTFVDPTSLRAPSSTALTVDLATAIGAKCKIEQTFVMAWVRHPWQRCWQEFHELIQRKGGSSAMTGAVLPTYAEFAHDLCAGSRSFQFLSPSSTLTVPQVIRSFHFIGVAERHDESVVALAIMLGLSPSDLGKPHWWDNAGPTNKTATRTFAKEDSNQSLFETINNSNNSNNSNSSNINDSNKKDDHRVDGDNKVHPGASLDYELYTASNKALDNLIEKLGRTRFEDALLQYQKIPQQVIITTKTGRTVVRRR